MTATLNTPQAMSNAAIGHLLSRPEGARREEMTKGQTGRSEVFHVGWSSLGAGKIGIFGPCRVSALIVIYKATPNA